MGAALVGLTSRLARLARVDRASVHEIATQTASGFPTRLLGSQRLDHLDEALNA